MNKYQFQHLVAFKCSWRLLNKDSLPYGKVPVVGTQCCGAGGSGSTIEEKLNFKNVPQKFTVDTTCKYWYGTVGKV